ncbi:MAG TPA: response regulator [Bryobacteraceae bacterium]|nr:response regulator [Bryobacteraceae bacterium]
MKTSTLLAVTPYPADQQSLIEILRPHNWNIRTVRTCKEARTYLSHAEADVILCECKLPDGMWRNLLNSLETLSQHLPIVVMSRDADESLWAEVLNLGGYDVLQKPFDQMEVQRVAAMAQRHHERHANDPIVPFEKLQEMAATA